VSVFVLSSPLDLLTYHCPVRSSMHAAVAVDQRHIRSKKLRPLIVPMYAQRPAWQAWRGLCFRMSGPRDWDAAKRARLKCHWGGGEGSEESRKPKLVGIAPTRCKSFLVGLTSLPRSVGGSAPEKPTRGRTPGNSGHSTVRGTSALTASRFLLSSHLTSCILRPPQQQDTRGTTHGRVLPAPFPWARQTCSTGAVYKSSLTLLRRQPDLQVQAERQAS
jgi:hypothetical protein